MWLKWEGVEDMKEEVGGFHVICGTGPKNGIRGVTPGIVGEGRGAVLDLTGLSSLLVSDIDYFVGHHEELLELVKKQIERRDYFREHPEELVGGD